MKLLLDTHIWLWVNQTPQRLSPRVSRELQRSSNEIYLSPVSIWEVRNLVERGRFKLRTPFAEWLSRALASPLREAPVTFEVAAEAARITLPQNDPGDVFIAATTSAFGLTLVTADTQLLSCSWLKTMAND